MSVLFFILIGLVLFLGGLRLMSLGLEALWGTSFAKTLEFYTQNRVAAFICGLLFTAVTQSSSLATIIVVGVVDAGLISLHAAIAVIIGANVGTTVTGQLLSFHLYDYALPLAVAGILLIIAGGGKKRSAGRALTGLAVLLFGLKTMGGALAPFSETGWFLGFIQAAAVHPLLGVAVGAATTSVVQSSTAVVGVVLSLANSGALNLAAGAAILVGADVGTCVDTMLAGFVSGRAARQAAFAHLLFNVCSVIVVLPFFSYFTRLAEASAADLPRQLANAHTIYNLGGAIVILLFLHPFQSAVETLVSDGGREKRRISTVFSEVLRKWF